MAEHEHPDAPRGTDPEPGATAAGSDRIRPLLALAATVPLVVAAGAVALTPPPDPSPVPRAETVSEPGAGTRWCPGPLQLPEDLLQAGVDEELSVTAPSPIVDLGTVSAEPASSVLFGTVSASQTLQQDDGSIRTPTITASGADGAVLSEDASSQDLGISVQQLPGLEAAPHVTSATSQQGRPVMDTLQSTRTPGGDYRSLSLSRCSAPTTQATFLGVATGAGDSSVLVLRNTTERPATASVQVWTEQGPAPMEGRSQVVVAPGEEQRVLLESIVPDQEAVGVRAAVLGAPLSMHVQTTERDGLTPGGAEILSPLPGSDTDLLMPGVDVAGTAPTLVLANPRGEDTTAAVQVHGPDGPVAVDGVDEVDVPAGTVLRLPLEGLADGTYAVSVTAQHPLTAVTRAVRAGEDLPGDTIGAPVDFALVAPAPAIGSHALTALPPGGAAGELTLTGSADSAVTVIPIAADGSAGQPLQLEVTAGTTTAVPASRLALDGGPAAALSVVPAQPGVVHAGWTQRGSDGTTDSLLSTYPVRSGAGSGDAVTVRLAP